MQFCDKTVREERHSERGATATEYGLLVAFIAVVIAFGVGVFGTALTEVFSGFGDWVVAKL